MSITIEIPHDIEIQIRKNAAHGNANAVRHLLIEALDPTVESLLRDHAPLMLSNDQFEALVDQLADTFTKYLGSGCLPLSDYAVSREGLYADHL